MGWVKGMWRIEIEDLCLQRQQKQSGIQKKYVPLAQRIEDAGLMTKRLFKTLILENMKSLKKVLDEKAEQYDKE